eukprot:Skav227910  [mRNA]  locus=scaffold146:90801:101548:+ [translate_table: standard]
MAELCSKDAADDVISKKGPPVVNSFSGDGLVHYRCQEQENEPPVRIVVKGLKDLRPEQQVVVHGTEVAEILSHDQKTNKYKARCMKMSQEEEDNDPLPDPVEKKVGSIQVASSFLEEAMEKHEIVRSHDLSKVAQVAKEEHSQKTAKAVIKDQPLLLRPWPVKLSFDTDRVFHVDSCWTSPLNCSDGQPAQDTARYLQKDSARHPNLGAIDRSWILGAGHCQGNGFRRCVYSVAFGVGRLVQSPGEEMNTFRVRMLRGFTSEDICPCAADLEKRGAAHRLIKKWHPVASAWVTFPAWVAKEEAMGVATGSSSDSEIKKAHIALDIARIEHAVPLQIGIWCFASAAIFIEGLSKAGSEASPRQGFTPCQVLSDSEKRAKYDKFGEEGLDNDGPGDASDIFEAFFGGGGRRGGGPRKRQKTKDCPAAVAMAEERLKVA